MLPLRMLGLLLLMFLQCDADSTCPTELNPLYLEPPEIIKEYGSEVYVNCTSRNKAHNGMFWKDRETEVEKGNYFISKNMSMSEWNAEVQCKIKLNGTIECSKDLKITVYKNPEAVHIFPINHGTTAEKETIDLQCDIVDVAPVQNLRVRWYKDNQTIKTDSFSNTTKTPVSASSVLTVNNSRGDNGAQFKCEAQLDFALHGPQRPVSSTTYTHSVHYAPEFKNKTDINKVYVGEGDKVTLNCEADGNPRPVFHWIKDGKYLTETTPNLYINQVNISTTYNCIADNFLGSITKQIHIHVVKITVASTPGAIVDTTVATTAASTVATTAAPTVATTEAPPASAPIGCTLTLTPAEIAIQFGAPASVVCSTSATDVVGMGWEATIGGTGFETDVHNVTWRVNHLKDWSIEPKCYMSLDNNDTCEEVPKITLYKTPETLSVSATNAGPMVEGKECQLKCDIIDVAPVRNLKVKWYRGNETVHTKMFNDTIVTPVNKSSTLRFTPKRDYNGVDFRCEAELHLGPKGPELIPTTSSAPYTAVVHYKPRIQDCPRRYAGVEHGFSMDMVRCQADGNPPPTLLWSYQGAPINASEPLTRTHSGEYTAEFVNNIGNCSTSVEVTIEYSPSFTCGDRRDVEEDGIFQTICEPEGIPTPIITWFKDGKKMASSQRRTKHDSGEYILTATNKHGIANHTLYLNVLYAPEIKVGDNKKDVTPGENVTFDCSAEGNPPPDIFWEYPPVENVGQTTSGHQTYIRVTGATSTNAGVYTCIATNDIGTVKKIITLTMIGTGSSVPLWILCVVIAILLILLILLLIIIYLKCCKNKGQYSFVPNRANDGLDIPMNTNPTMQA